MTLRITVTEEKDAVIMELAGKIDSFSTEELQEGFRHVLETGRREIILFLKGLEYLDSRGIGAFLAFFKTLRDGGGKVRLAQAPPNILELFNVLGVEDLAEVYPSLTEALENSRRKGPAEDVRGNAQEEVQEPLLQDDMPPPNKAPYVLVGAGILIVVILVFLFLKPAKKASGPENETGIRLELLERRIAQVESREGAPLAVQEKVESLSRDISKRLTLIEKDLSRLKEDMASLKRQAATAGTAEKEQAPPAHHVVSRGETLFRIAARYNTTVEELRRLNDLRPDQPLLVGQRLRVRAQ